MEVVAAFEANEESTVLVQPGEVPFDDPAMATEFGAGLDALAGDARRDAPAPEAGASLTGIVRLVGMELVGAASWSSTTCSWAAAAAPGRSGRR